MNNREFADIRFILFVPLCDCSNAAPMPNLKHRTLHRMVDLDLELYLKFVLLKVFYFLQIVFDVQWFIQNYFVV